MAAGLRHDVVRREFLGHPRGLWVLAGTELWDRISFHGMQAILTLYLAKELLLPGRIDHVVAFGTFREAIEALTGPLSVAALATQTFGIYIAMVYATPLLGGWIGDRFLSRRLTVTLGALLMTLGHFSLAFDQSFLFGMLFLAIGAGLLRGNLSPQVKTLYPAGDRRQGDAFQLYSLSISFGAFVAPLATGTLAAFYGWHTGFAFAGFGMLIGLVIYLAGQRHLPDEPRIAKSERKPLTSVERIRVGWLLALWPLFVCFWVAQSQIWNTYNLWVSDHIEMNVGGFPVPVPWLQSLDGLMPAATVPLMLALWRRQARSSREPAMLIKMGIGCLIFGGSVLILVFASHLAAATARAPILLPIAFHVFSNIGWIYFAPVATAFLMTRAPEQTRGTFYGVNALSVTAASLISGRLGGLYEKLPASEFWLIHAAIVGTAGAVFLLIAGPLGRRLPEIASEQVEAAPPPDAVPLPV
jgi:POT family proton-dependent oligopeptide transporter